MKYTADAVVARRTSTGTVEVLMIRRAKPPFLGGLALPGGHVNPGESPLVAAERELQEETGLSCSAICKIGVYSAEGRDPRGPYTTEAYLMSSPGTQRIEAGDDAASAEWIEFNEDGTPVDSGNVVAFDHADIIRHSSVLWERSI